MIDIRKVIAVLLVSGAAGLVSVDNVQTASAKSTPTTTKKASSQPANQNALDKGSVPGLWAQGYRGQGMVVAVIDSGIQANKEFTLSDTSTAAISKTQAEQMIAKKKVMVNTLVRKFHLPMITSIITTMIHPQIPFLDSTA